MLIKLGSVITEASGKLNGMVVQKDHSGMHLRVNSYKKRAYTYYKYSSQASLKECSVLWRSLTATQRKLWLTFPNRFNNGYTAFIYNNFYRRLLGFSTLLSPAIDDSVFNWSSANVIIRPLVNVMTISISPDRPPSLYVIIYASKPFMHIPSHSSIKYKIIVNNNSPTYSGSNINTYYINRFGFKPPLDSYVYFKIECLVIPKH